MARARFVFFVIGATLLVGSGLGSRAAEITELPQGPDRDLVAKTCQACHDLQMVFDGAGASREDWDGALDQMATYGMMVTPDERARILGYLAAYLGPSAKRTAPGQ
jgi:hypothetical protein